MLKNIKKLVTKKAQLEVINTEKQSQSETVGTRWHLMSSDDSSSLSNLVSATCESSGSALLTYSYL